MGANACFVKIEAIYAMVTQRKNVLLLLFFFKSKGKIVIYKYTNYTRPSMKEGIVGWRCDQRLALPRQRAIARRPKRCLVMLNESVEVRRCSKAIKLILVYNILLNRVMTRAKSTKLYIPVDTEPLRRFTDYGSQQPPGTQ